MYLRPQQLRVSILISDGSELDIIGIVFLCFNVVILLKKGYHEAGVGTKLHPIRWPKIYA